MECLLPYLCMVNVPHVMVGLERMLDYRGVRLGRFHCITSCTPGFNLNSNCDISSIKVFLFRSLESRAHRFHLWGIPNA